MGDILCGSLKIDTWWNIGGKSRDRLIGIIATHITTVKKLKVPYRELGGNERLLKSLQTLKPFYKKLLEHPEEEYRILGKFIRNELRNRKKYKCNQATD